MEFSYSVFAPEQRRFAPLTGDDLPTRALGDPNLELVDLFGRGLPDVLELNGVARYWRNLGEGRFDRPRPMRAAPAGLALADPGVQLLDADGDGRIDLLVTRDGLAGYFPLAFDGGWDARSFRPYRQAPSFSLEDPTVKLLDLNGDGVIDALRGGARLECFFNDPRRGWTATRAVERRALERFPNVDFADPRVRLADMSGDQLQDIVLITDGEVAYWPNLGHGDWGPRISMRHGPRFPRGYDPRRILLGDVDGDGLADLVYVDDGRVTLWVNQSGNGWGDPITITGTPLVTDTGAVRMGDLFGLGIAGVLWSTEATAPGRPHHWFLDFTGGVKPYLLDAMNNHMGAVTRVEYAASTRYFLADQSDSRYRWRTPLPFPVQVVARVEVIDQISDGKLTTEYRYHHGYWDGAEREFRGFGMVEQFDSEQFVDYNGAGLHVDTYFRPVDVDHFAPPTLTRTWFHQGPIGPEEGDWAEVDRSHEYWAGDPPLLGHTTVVNAFLASLPHRRPDRLPDRRSRRDALRALRGRILRTELYADNGSTQRDRPYTVTEYAYGLREEKPPNTSNVDRPRIFFPYLIAERTTQWERGDDPLTTFSFTAGYDTFGQPQTQTTVACPRGWRHLDDRFKGYLATRTVTTYATPVVAADYIHDRVAEVSSYEIDPSRVATIAELRSLPAGNPSLRLISRILNFYDDNPAQPNNGAFVGRALGQVGNYGALVRSERLALTEHVIQQAYGGRLPHFAARGAVAWPAEYPHAFQQRLPAGAGYDYRPGGAADPYVDGYFIVAEQRRYDFHAGAGGRGLVRATRDPLGEETAIIYEAPYDHLPQKVTDPTGLETTATYAYRVLQPEKVTDPNGNETTFAFTPLGLLGATWVRGNPARNEGDRSRPGLHLSYDFLAGYRSDGREPIAVRSVRHTHHDTELDVPQPERDETIETREYSDGFGRLVQTRVQAEDVRFGNPTFGDGVLPAQQGHPADAQPVVGRLPANPSRPAVVVSGWKVYDNKGRVVEQYEPFFDEGWAFRPPGPRGERIQMYYDPRGRVVRTVNPDGSEQRVIYGVPADLAHPEEFAPTPWETYTYDANDNAGRTHRSQSRDYQEHWDTPASAVIDALGRVVRAIARTRAAGMLEQHHTTSTYDIRGNLLRVTDPLGRVVLTQVYDLADRPLRAESLDAGIRWTVLDARGGMLEQRHTGTGRLQLRAFDRLGRTSRLWARDDGTSLPTLREWLEYGDDEPNRTAARAANRLGQPYVEDATGDQCQPALGGGRRCATGILCGRLDAPRRSWRRGARPGHPGWDTLRYRHRLRCPRAGEVGRVPARRGVDQPQRSSGAQTTLQPRRGPRAGGDRANQGR